METYFVPFLENGKFGKRWLEEESAETLDVTRQNFSDGETYLSVDAKLKDREIAVICSLDRPDAKSLSLFFLSGFLRERGATRVGLIAPYLGYTRPDQALIDSEAPTSTYFARLISQHFDWLVTVDPEMNHRKSLSEIYRIPTEVVHSGPIVSKWIEKNITRPVLMAPHPKCESWMSSVARQAGLPSEPLHKNAKGMLDIELSRPHFEKWRGRTPVIVDNVVSTGRQMIEMVRHVREFDLLPPVCLVVHPILVGRTYEELMAAGAGSVVSCNTIAHESAVIDVSQKLMEQALEIGFIR